MTTEDIKELYYTYNTRGDTPFTLSPYFEASLDRAIARGDIREDHLSSIGLGLVEDLRTYAQSNKVHTVVIGMSGGIDSALTASLFKAAGWNVIGVTMPIHQLEDETSRGIEACHALDIKHEHVDLSSVYDNLVEFYQSNDVDFNTELMSGIPQEQAKRKGNLRARLRMITLYNYASKNSGIVASTDNFSELAAGFWTLHGDVGDVAPIQSLTKSWEVPMLSSIMKVPEHIITATPTDGLGISTGDESQFGHSYAQLDLALLDAMHNVQVHRHNPSQEDLDIIKKIEHRIASTTFKRVNPVNCMHPMSGDWRYQQLALLDKHLIANNLGEN
jgi:NAD+ synthetase